MTQGESYLIGQRNKDNKHETHETCIFVALDTGAVDWLEVEIS